MAFMKETLKTEKERSNRLLNELKTQSVMVGKIKKKITHFLKNQRRQSKSCTTNNRTWSQDGVGPFLDKHEEELRKKSQS